VRRLHVDFSNFALSFCMTLQGGHKNVFKGFTNLTASISANQRGSSILVPCLIWFSLVSMTPPSIPQRLLSHHFLRCPLDTLARAP